MRTASAVLIATVMIWLIPTQSAGQSMVQYGVAAGAGTVAGTAAGKHVSNGITAIFGKTAAAARKAANRGEPPTLELSDEEVQALRRRQAAEAERLRLEREAAARKHRTPGNSLALRARTEEASNWMPTPIWLRQFTLSQPAVPARRAITPERLINIAEGASRADVFGSLGTPVARVVIPEGNQIQEVLYYQEKGHTVGTVRLSAGSVTSVVVNAN